MEEGKLEERASPRLQWVLYFDFRSDRRWIGEKEELTIVLVTEKAAAARAAAVAKTGPRNLQEQEQEHTEQQNVEHREQDSCSEHETVGERANSLAQDIAGIVQGMAQELRMGSDNNSMVHCDDRSCRSV